MTTDPAIILMCKAPVAGTVKTRLQPFLSPGAAVSLSRAFAEDTASKARQICKNVIVAFAPPNGKDLLERVLPAKLIWIAQSGLDLGERMHNALQFAFEKNFSPLVMIGTDSPTLPLRFIKQAFSILLEECADVVLGETEDGGYYLVGVNEPDFGIFDKVEWSSPHTFEQTSANIKRSSLRLEVLPVWYDVDLPVDLWRLRDEILTDVRAAEIACKTADWLRQNEQLFQASRKTSL